MKITIELTEKQVKGIKAYLADTDGSNAKITNKEITDYIAGIVHGNLEAPQEAVSDYINKA